MYQEISMIVAKGRITHIKLLTCCLGPRSVCDGKVALRALPVTFCIATTSDLKLSQAAPGFRLPQHG